jgi:hypothetical protein
MSTKTHLALLLTGMAWAAGSAIGAEMSADQQALLKALPEAKITLQQGLAASASQGQPLSAKFEIDEGHFQLSVYTAKGSAFSEVIVDYTTGKIAKAEAITEADDLSAARKQSAAAAQATSTLAAAVDKAEHDLAGYRAVSVTTKLRQHHAVALVTLVKGQQFKSISEPLE